jgi:hypothetical protein
MAATKVKITLGRVAFLRNKAFKAKTFWTFDAKVTQVGSGKTTTIGDPAAKFEAKPKHHIDLNWTAEIDLALSDTQLKISIKGTDVGGVAPVSLGEIEVNLNVPIAYARKPRLSSSKERFVLTVQVDVLNSTPGFAGPVTTILQNCDSSTHNTIHKEMAARMVHIHPVIPVPWAFGLPPVAKGVEAMDATDEVNFGIDSTATDLNAMINPCMIPVIDPLDADFDQRCAIIRITQMRPKDLDTAKFIWKSNSASIQFWDGAAKSEIKGGDRVKAYGHLTGDDDEEGTIEVRWDAPGRPLLATFRCWIGKVKYVWTRFNIIKTNLTKHPDASNPTADAALAKKLIAFNNIIMWQAAIQLVLDTDETAYDGAVMKEPGVFEITSDQNYTFNVADDADMVAPMLNSRAGVFSINVVHSVRGASDLLGEATDRRLTPGESEKDDGTATSDGSPSTSWIRPSGVFPDDPGQTITMKTMAGSSARDKTKWTAKNYGDGGIDKLCAVIITEMGSNTEGDLTIAHELCHVLGLHHRGNGGRETFASYDKVNQLAGPRQGRGHPWEENLMTYGDNETAQDIDILQAGVIRQHALLQKNPPPKKPPPPKPVPEAWLPTKDDIILLQEYLIGKKPGLLHKGYDIGDYGPDHDGVDGILGPETKKGIRQFQKDHGGLAVDGKYGPKTRAAFDEELNGKK